MDRELSEVATIGGEYASGTLQATQVSKKELGRLKHKRALLAKVQGDVQVGDEKLDAEERDLEQPETKKTKPEHEDDMPIDAIIP